MKALRKLRPGSGGVDLVDVEEAVVLPSTVIVAVAATGVCGTDLHIEAGEWATAPPMTMGHEICGVVAQIGAGVTESWLGERVVCETQYDTCDACRWCRAGQRNLCPRRRSLGTHVDGGFATKVVVPARNLHRVPDGVGARAAALSEPLACVCHALLDPPLVNAGDRVLVTGPGSMGLLAAQVAVALGAKVHVTGLPSDKDRLPVAVALGATVSEGEAPNDIDVAIECSGSSSGAQLCLDALRPAGRYVQVGVFGRDVTLNLDTVLLKEITLTSGFASIPTSWERAMTLLAERSVQLEPLLSDVIPLEQWRAAFDGLREGSGIKTVLTPE